MSHHPMLRAVCLAVFSSLLVGHAAAQSWPAGEWLPSTERSALLDEKAFLERVCRTVGDACDDWQEKERAVPQLPLEVELARFLEGVTAGRDLASLPENDLVERGERIVTRLDELRLTGKALFNLSRSTLDLAEHEKGGAEAELETWLDATARRGLDTLELLGRQWIRLQQDEDRPEDEDESARRELAEGEGARKVLRALDEVLSRPEISSLGRQLSPRRLRTAFDAVNGGMQAGALERLAALRELAEAYDEVTAENFHHLLTAEAGRTCRRLQALGTPLGPECPRRLGELQATWDKVNDQGQDDPADAALGRLLTWLKRQAFLYRQLLDHRETAEQPLELAGEELRAALKALHQRIAEAMQSGAGATVEDLARTLTKSPGEDLEALRQLLFPSESSGEAEGGLSEQVRHQVDVARRMAAALGIKSAQDLTQERLDEIVERARDLRKLTVVLEKLWDGFGPLPSASDLSVHAQLMSWRQEAGGIVADLEIAWEAPDEEKAEGRRIRSGFVAQGLRLGLPDALSRQGQEPEALFANLTADLASRLATARLSASPTAVAALENVGWPSGLLPVVGDLQLQDGFEVQVLGGCLFVAFSAQSDVGSCHEVSWTEVRQGDALQQAVLTLAREKLAASREDIAEWLEATLLLQEVDALAARVRDDLDGLLQQLPVEILDDGRLEATLHLSRLDARRDSFVVIRLDPDDPSNVDVSGEIGPRDQIGLLTALLPLRVENPRSTAAGVWEATVYLHDGKRDLARLGSAVLRDDGKHKIHELDFDDVKLGGGFTLIRREAEISFQQDAVSFDGVELVGPGDLRIGIDLEVLQDSGTLRWRPRAGSSKKNLTRFASRWLQRYGLLPEGLTVSDVQIGSDGLKLSFDEVEDPRLSACARVLESSPISSSWVSALPGQLDDLRACRPEIEAAAAGIESFIAFLKDGLQSSGLPRPEGKVDLGSAGALVYTCRGKVQDVYGECDVELRFDHLLCGAQGPTFFFSSDGNRPLLNEQTRSCLRELAQSYVEGLSNDDFQVDYDTEKGRVLLTFPGLIDDAPSPRVWVSLEGKVGIDAADLERFAKEKLKEVERQAKKEAKELLKDTFGDLESALREQLHEVEKSLRIEIRREDKLDLPQLGFVLEICYRDAVGDQGEKLCIDDVELTLRKGVSFERAHLSDPKAVEAVVKKLLGSTDGGSVAVKLREARFEKTGPVLLLTLRVNVDGLKKPLVADFDLNLANGRLELSDDVLLASVAGALQPELENLNTESESWKLEFKKLKSHDGRLTLSGTATMRSEVVKIPVGFELAVPVTRSGEIKLRVTTPPPTDLLNEASAALLDELDLKLGDFKVTFNSPKFKGDENSMPRALAIDGKATLFGFEVGLPEILIEASGVRFGELRTISGTVPGSYPIPPYFELSHLGFALSPEEFRLQGDFSLQALHKVAYLRGIFTIRLKEPLHWNLRGELVVLTVLDLGYSEADLDFAKGFFRLDVHLGGRLSGIIEIRGWLEINGPATTIDGEGNVRLFGIDAAEGTLHLNLGEGTVLITGSGNLPPFGEVAELRFAAEQGFRNPTLRAESKLRLLGITLAGAGVEVRPRTAELSATALGIRVTVVTPSYHGLEDALLEILKRLLFPDLANLDKALLAILSGNISINPFGDFGPADGGVMGKGGDDEGDGEGDGDSSTGNYADAGNTETPDANAPDAPKGQEAAEAEVEPAQEEVPPGGVPAIFQPAGRDRLIFLASENDHSTVVLKPGDQSEQQDITRVPETAGGHQQLRPGPASAGTVLLFDDESLSHALKLAGGETVVYTFSGLEDVRYGRVPLTQLDGAQIDHRWLTDHESTPENKVKRRLMRIWLADLPFQVRNAALKELDGPDLVENAFLFKGRGGNDGTKKVTAFCVRYRGDGFYTIYFTSSSKRRAKIVLLRDLRLVDVRTDPEKERFLAELLLKLLKRKLKFASLSQVDGKLYAATSEEVLRWDGESLEMILEIEETSSSSSIPGGSEREAAIEALEVDAGGHEEAEAAKEEARAAREGAGTLGIGTGGVSVTIEEAEQSGLLSVKIGEGGLLQVPKTYSGSELVLFQKRGDVWDTAGRVVLVNVFPSWYSHIVGDHLYWHVTHEGSSPKLGRIPLQDLALSEESVGRLEETQKHLVSRLVGGTANNLIESSSADVLEMRATRLPVSDGILGGYAVKPSDAETVEIYLALKAEDDPEPWTARLSVTGLGDLATQEEERSFAVQLAPNLARRGLLSARVFQRDKERFVLAGPHLEYWSANAKTGLVLGEVVLADSRMPLPIDLEDKAQRAFDRFIGFLLETMREEAPEGLIDNAFVLLKVEGYERDSISVRFRGDQARPVHVFVEE